MNLYFLYDQFNQYFNQNSDKVAKQCWNSLFKYMVEDYDYKSLSEMNTQVPTKPMMSDIEDKGSGKSDYLNELKNLYNKYQKGKESNVQLTESQIQKGEEWLKNF